MIAPASRSPRHLPAAPSSTRGREKTKSGPARLGAKLRLPAARAPGEEAGNGETLAAVTALRCPSLAFAGSGLEGSYGLGVPLETEASYRAALQGAQSGDGRRQGGFPARPLSALLRVPISFKPPRSPPGGASPCCCAIGSWGKKAAGRGQKAA